MSKWRQGSVGRLRRSAFKTFLFNSDMMAYLAMMAPRLVELRRVHYLRVPEFAKPISLPHRQRKRNFPI